LLSICGRLCIIKLMNLSKWFVIALIVFSPNAELKAQDIDAENDTMAQIKIQINTLLEENDRLEGEYKLLFANAQSLRQSIEQYQGEMKPLEEQFNQNIKTKEAEQKSLKDLQNGLERIKNDTAEKKKINERLNNESRKLDRGYKILANQSKDLQKETAALEKEIKFREFTLEEERKRESLEIKDLQMSLKKLEQKEGLLNSSGKGMAQPSSKNKLNKIIEQNNLFTQQINELEKKIKKKQKEIVQSKNKNGLASKSTANLVWEKEKEKIALVSNVKDLESQLEVFNRTVNDYLSQQAKREQLLEEIMKLNQENDSLKQRIAILEEQTNTLRQ